MTGLKYNQNINDIATYVPGKSSITGFDKVIKLSSNENPYGTSHSAIMAYQKCAEKLYKYPNGAATNLIQAIADFNQIDAERIVCGAGSDNILELLCIAFAQAGDNIIFSKYSFPVYRIAAQMVGAKTIEIPYQQDYKHDINAIIQAINEKTKLIFIATPDNPTGNYVCKTDMQKLINALPPQCLLVIDEAYFEYIDAHDYKTGLEFANQYPNVAVTRTFSKIFGLAALRVGWGYLPPVAVEALNKIRSPFNVSMPAQEAAIAVLSDKVWIQDKITRNNQQRKIMTDYYQLNNFQFIPSQANFICLIRNDTHQFDAFLKSHGIIVRNMSGNGTPELVRISIGTEEENKKLQIILSQYLAGEF
jgi:histidinol-phosphate aminotransferase